VIHIGTSHYRDDRWIELQLRYLERHTQEPYRVYASLDGIDARHYARFDYAADHGRVAPELEEGWRPEPKLKLLVEEMTREATPDDLLVFMHGDAFPIADWVGPARKMVAESQLAAVRRDENLEPIPHWSFCVTTAGFWTDIGGDWSRGASYERPNGDHATDTGAKLWKVLERRGIAWHPILRSNKRNLHPLWFAIYGDIVYHHGAGFHTPISRLDAAGYSHLPIPLRNVAGLRRRIANTVQSRRMFRRIHEDERFYLALTGGDLA
jgi:hypothetical protein